MNKKDIAYLNHILESIINIEDFSRSISSASSLNDHTLERAGIERMLTIIGEAAKNISRNCETGIHRFHGKRSPGCATRLCIIILALIMKQSMKPSGMTSLN